MLSHISYASLSVFTWDSFATRTDRVNYRTWPPAAEQRKESSRRGPHKAERSEEWSVGEMTWARSELTAVYCKHLSRMPPVFVVAGM